MELKENNLLFYDLCRLCLVNSGIKVIEEDSDLQQNVFVSTGVKVSVTDNLPSKICNTCYDIVKTTIDFREAVTKNDVLLKSLYGETNSEKEMENKVLITDITDKVPFEETENRYLAEQTQNKNSPESNNNYTYSCIINLTSTSTPLGTLTIRKDLFPSSVQETHKNSDRQKTEIDCERKVQIKKPKCEEMEVVQYRCEETHKEEIDCEGKEKIKKPKNEETEVVQYRCEECRRNFETWRKLYHHTRQHKKTKACPVDRCGKMFSTKSDLEKHIRIHTGERPYRCELCGKCFTQNGTLNSHKDAVHSEDRSEK